MGKDSNWIPLKQYAEGVPKHSLIELKFPNGGIMKGNMVEALPAKSVWLFVQADQMPDYHRGKDVAIRITNKEDHYYRLLH